jgi:hypothetical protein
MDSRKLALLCREFADNKKAENIVILDVHKISSVTDFFVIASGTSEPHLRAIVEEISIPEIHELDGHGKFLRAHGGDDGLQFVAALAVHAHGVALNLCRHLELAVADEAGDLLGDGGFDALLDLDELPRVAERRDVRLALLTLFRLMPRLASLPMTISLSVVTLNWSSAESLISFFSKTISALLPLKSKRLASSFLAWLTAFSISIELTCETMSNEGMKRTPPVWRWPFIRNHKVPLKAPTLAFRPALEKFRPFGRFVNW